MPKNGRKKRLPGRKSGGAAGYDPPEMTIQAGERIPEATLRTMTPEGVSAVSTAAVFGGRRVALFGVPGAFTPTCSDTHLPGFLLRAEELARRGIDRVACVSVNDAFVMDAWGRALEVGDRVLMLADGNGELARAMGLEADSSRFGFGRRFRRFSAVVDDGVVERLWVEPAAGVDATSAETLLASLPD